MARKKTAPAPETLTFNVIYDDGSLSSNRKVALSAMDMLDDVEAAARAALEAQDRDIAERSGRPRGRIKSISRVTGR